MRIVFLGNNWVAWRVLSQLKEYDEEIVALVVHPGAGAKHVNEIIAETGLPGDRIFEATQIEATETLRGIKALKPDIALSVFFGYILKREFINIFPRGVVNLHPSYLPYNRGAYPNVWSIVDETPAGATLHYVDEGIDTGDIISKTRVEVELTDTGESLYGKLERACVELFRKTWGTIRTGEPPRMEPGELSGTYHRSGDVEAIDLIDLERSYGAKELINILRARTFPPYKGAYFVDNGRKVYLRLQLYGEDQIDGTED